MNYYFILVGGMFLAIGVAYLLQARKVERLGYHTLGEIVDIMTEPNKTGSRYKYTYYPIIRIITAEGATVDRKLDVGTSPSSWVKGKTMNVIYFNDKIHPTGWGWTLSYSFFALVGLGILIYQLVAL